MKKSELIYPDISIIRDLHEQALKTSGGGTEGEKSPGYIESICEHIKNDNYYDTFVRKLAHLVFGIVQFHCFIDGNKRTSITAGIYFLEMNGYSYVVKDFVNIMENTVIHVATSKIDKELLTEILENILMKTYDDNIELKMKIIKAIE
ncbi:MAG: type II toxin-antitoxin system death-on-curing family toxin [Clostridia bacterium]